MNNYEWQRQYTRQRIDSRLREAEARRRAAEGRAKQVGAAYAAAEIKARKDLEANGNVITEASPELVADIKKRLEPIEQDWVKRAKEKGMADPQAALNELRANVGG